MRDVLPTAASPTRQTFIFIRRTSMVRPCAPAFTRPTAYKRAENVINPEIDSRIARRMVGRETRRKRPRPNSIYPRCALWAWRPSMCDEYWEKELAKRWKILAEEDEMKWLPVLQEQELEEKPEAIVLPPPLIEDKKRSHRVLVR